MKFKETTNFGRLSLIILKYKATNMLTFALMKAIRYVGQGKIKSNKIYVKLNVFDFQIGCIATVVWYLIMNLHLLSFLLFNILMR